MEPTLQTYFIVCPLVFLAAVIDAIGGGGGLISLPAYLLTGLPPALAGGTNKLSASIGTLISTGKYLKDGKVHIKSALFAAMGSLPGAYLGALILQRIDEQIIRVFLLIAIPLMAVVVLMKRSSPAEIKPMTTGRLIACLLLGFGTGLYDGFFGPGTGTLIIMGLTYLIGMDMITASGTSKLVNLISNVSALSALIAGGNVLFSLALPAAVFSIAGGYLGSWLAIRHGSKFIRKILLVVLALLILKLATEWFL